MCYKSSLGVVVLNTTIPAGLEMVMIKIFGGGGQGTLFVGCYRPPSQRTVIMNYLTDNLDVLMTANQFFFFLH